MKPLEESAAARSDDATYRVDPKPEPGIRLARVVRCFGLARGNRDDACQIAQALYGDRDPEVVEFLKAITGQLGSIGSWLLWGTETTVLADFVEHVNQRTLVGRAQAVRVPFRVPVVSQSSTEAITLQSRRVTALVTVTEDTLRDSSPTAEQYLRDQLVQALARRLDDAFRADIGGDESQPIYLADEGHILVDVAHNLSVEHFERNLVVIKLQRTINWQRREE